MTTYKVTEKKLEKEGQAKKVHEFVAKHPSSTSAEIVKGLKSIKPNNVRWHVANLRANGFLKAASEKKAKKEKELKRPEKSAKALKQAIDNTEKQEAA
jgi:hypothetical protein